MIKKNSKLVHIHSYSVLRKYARRLSHSTQDGLLFQVLLTGLSDIYLAFHTCCLASSDYSLDVSNAVSATEAEPLFKPDCPAASSITYYYYPGYWISQHNNNDRKSLAPARLASTIEALINHSHMRKLRVDTTTDPSPSRLKAMISYTPALQPIGAAVHHPAAECQR